MVHRSRLISIAASVAILIGGVAITAIVTADHADAKSAKTKAVAKPAPASSSGRDASAPARSTYQSY
jgi:hypothetical protein